MDAYAYASAVAELARLVDAQGSEIVRLNGRLDAANEAIVILEARIALVNAAFNRYIDPTFTVAA